MKRPHPVFDAAAAVLAQKPASLRAYLEQNYDRLTQDLVTALGRGATKRDFWGTLAAEFAQAGIVGRRGGMNGPTLEQAWRRVVERRRGVGAVDDRSLTRGPPQVGSREIPEAPPLFMPIGGKGKI